jgi:hypothetical protein
MSLRAISFSRPLIWGFAAVLASSVLMHAGSASARDWMFRQGYFSHAPDTGDRVAQYSPLPWVEALPDVRPWMSGYRRARFVQRGPDGTVDETYRVENWNAGRGGPGGLDAEWERFHEAWKESFLSGGWQSPIFPNVQPNWGVPWGGFGGGGYGPGGFSPGGYGFGGYGTGYGGGYSGGYGGTWQPPHAEGRPPAGHPDRWPSGPHPQGPWAPVP